MLYRPDFLKQKRELIQEIIMAHNTASLNVGAITNINERRNQRLFLKAWKKAILKFNNPSQYDDELKRLLNNTSHYNSQLWLFKERLYHAYIINSAINSGLILLLIIAITSIVLNVSALINVLMWICISAYPIMLSLMGTAMLFENYFSLSIGQAFSPEALENQFQGSAFDKIIAELAVFSPEFIEQYSPLELRNIFSTAPVLMHLLDFKDVELDKLPANYLNQLANTLPHVISIEIKIETLDKMSFEQLRALAKIIPNAERIIVDDTNIATSENMTYLQSQIEINIHLQELEIICALHQLKKDTPSQPGTRVFQYPADIMNYVANFFPRPVAIKNGLERLDKPVYTENTLNQPF